MCSKGEWRRTRGRTLVITCKSFSSVLVVTSSASVTVSSIRWFKTSASTASMPSASTCSKADISCSFTSPPSFFSLRSFSSRSCKRCFCCALDSPIRALSAESCFIPSPRSLLVNGKNKQQQQEIQNSIERLVD